MKDPKICLTGSEPSTAELATRLGRPADFHEIRLDLLDDLADATFDLIRRHGRKVIATCRPRWAGGRFQGSEDDRIAIQGRAFAAGARYVDLEVEAVLGGACRKVTGALSSDRVLVSAHDFKDTSRIGHHVRNLRDAPCGATKLAVSVSSARDLVSLKRAGRALAGREELAIIGMGEAGLWTRVRPADFGSTWTFLAASEDRATAPGQVTWEQALALRLADSARLLPFALLGGPQVTASPGPEIYNRVFAEDGSFYQYLPMVATTADEALDACREFRVMLASVTMPLKTALGVLCKERAVRESEPINTLFLNPEQPRRRAGFNTDLLAFEQVYESLGVGAGTRILVLGDGATGCLAAWTAGSRGAVVSVASRSNRGRAPGVAVPWDDRASVACDGIVNCTPLGSDGTSCPWDPEAPLGAGWVVDLALHRGGPTPLVARASGEGRRVVTGFEFWCLQGARQMEVAKVDATPERLREVGARLGWR